VLEAPRAFARAFWVPEAIAAPSREERLRILMDRSTNLRSVVVLESREAAAGQGIGPGTAAITSFAAGEYEIATEAVSDGYLVLAETWYPGWEAWIDGVPAEVLRANHLVQAVRLPAGPHRVHFAFHSTRLRAGFLVSAAVVIGMLLAALRLRRT
ncbi:MAG TPA: hypothetical protein VE981_06030, partial [Planctomycetota bacterium]|nr:hypothetical protein [Planctomycetota bacterium]